MNLSDVGCTSGPSASAGAAVVTDDLQLARLELLQQQQRWWWTGWWSWTAPVKI